MYFQDLSEEEEAQIPLPAGWIQTIKFDHDHKSGTKLTRKTYCNSTAGYEQDTHPVVAKALRQAKKLSLPHDWSLLSRPSTDGGGEDTLYVNADRNIGMKNHPLLRYCIVDCLQGMGLDINCIQIKEPLPPEDSYHSDSSEDDEEEARYSARQPRQPSPAVNKKSPATTQPTRSPGDIRPPMLSPLMRSYSQQSLRNSSERINNNAWTYQDEAMTVTQLDDDNAINVELDLDEEGKSPGRGNKPNKVLFTPKYDEVIEERVTESDIQRSLHDITNALPPCSAAGLSALRFDILEMNYQVHQLLAVLRGHLANDKGLLPLLITKEDFENTNHTDNTPFGRITNTKVIALASDIITQLKQQPEHVVTTIAQLSGMGGSVAMGLAFIFIHRVLHPFSTDPSHTTALLLQGINHQLDAYAKQQTKQLRRSDRSATLHCLLIPSLEECMEWNPFTHVLPVTPVVTDETVFATLLRAYSLRRDVSAYYRTILRPVLPSILTLLSTVLHRQSTVLFQNLLTVAERVLDLTFSEQAMASFPSTATAIAQALNEIGTNQLMQTTVFYYLILPNVVKILCSDHDSLENEMILGRDNNIVDVNKLVNRCYDHRWWMTPPFPSTAKGSMKEDKDVFSLDMLRSLLWMIWRLFSCSVYTTDEQITAMTSSQFCTERFSSSTSWNTNYLTDDRLHKLLTKIRRRVEVGSMWLMKMPVDITGSQYLHPQHMLPHEDHNVLHNSMLRAGQAGEGHGHEDDDMMPSHDMNAIWIEKRIQQLQFKPNEMLNLTVLSRAELSLLFTDIACCLKDSIDAQQQVRLDDDQAQGMISLLEALENYLMIFQLPTHGNDFSSTANDKQDDREELLQLNFLYLNHAANTQSEQEINEEYQQLSRGISLLRRYRLALLLLLRRTQQSRLSSVHELIADELYHVESNLDLDFYGSNINSKGITGGSKGNKKAIFERHTEGSRRKQRDSLNGMKQTRDIQLFPLFSQQSQADLHPNIKSLKAMQAEVFASYRFGSSQRGVDVGSSIARSGTGKQPPSIRRGLMTYSLIANAEAASSTEEEKSNNTSHGMLKGSATAGSTIRPRSKYTQPTIKSDTSLLAPTKSTLHRLQPEGEYPSNDHPKVVTENFEKSMRTYQVISTEEFRMRYFQRRKNWFGTNGVSESQQQQYQQQEYLDTVVSNMKKKKVGTQQSQQQAAVSAGNGRLGPAPQPFPEHLRHRIRGYNRYDDNDDDQGDDGAYDEQDGEEQYGEEQDDEQEGQRPPQQPLLLDRITMLKQALRQRNDGAILANRTASSTPSISSKASLANNNNSNGRPQVATWQRDPTFFRSLIQDYRTNIQQPSRLKQDAEYEAEEEEREQEKAFDFTSEKLRSRVRQQARSRSPTFPQPMPNVKTNFNAPTASMLSKLKHRPIVSDDFLRDLHAGRTPQLRQYDHEVAQDIADNPAVTMMSTSRTPKKPEFLTLVNDEDVAYTSISGSRDTSRTPSRSTSRAPSRSVSPSGSRRSGTGSFAKATISSSLKQQQQPLPPPSSIVASAPVVVPDAVVDLTAHMTATSRMSMTADSQQEDSVLQSEKSPEIKRDRKISANKKTSDKTSDKKMKKPDRRDDKGSAANVMAPLVPSAPPIVVLPPASSALLSASAPPAPTTTSVSIISGGRGRRSSRSRSRSPPASLQQDEVEVSRPPLASGNSGNRKQQTFAEAFAAAAAAQTTSPAKGIGEEIEDEYVEDDDEFAESPTRYSISFKAPSISMKSTDHIVDLQADREAAAHRIYGDSEDEDEDDEYYRTIGYSPKEGEAAGASESGAKRIPVIRRKSTLGDHTEVRRLFTDGVLVTKHGRSGLPKEKLVKYLQVSNSLQWFAPSSTPQQQQQALGPKRPSLFKRASTFFSSTASLQTSSSANATDGIVLDDVTEVRKGVTTEVLRRAGLLDPNCCLSIITAQRSLDLQFRSTSERNQALRALRLLLSEAGNKTAHFL